MRLPDANVLLYALNTEAQHHEPARAWLESALNGAETVGFAWNVLLGVVRIGTSPSAFAEPLTADEAIAIVQGWLNTETTTIVHPTPRHAEILGDLLAAAGTAGNLTSDAHLAALAIEHGATIVSTDHDFARFPGVRWTNPLA